jgi:hypothetical protein
MSDFIIAQIRTYVPMLVGAFISWLAVFQLDLIDVEAELVTVITALLSALYYFLVRWGAEHFPWLGVLLGVNIAPKYDEPAPEAPAE